MFPLVCFSFDRLLHKKKNKDDKRSNIIKNNDGLIMHSHSVHCNRGALKMNLPLQQMDHKREERRRMKKEEEIKERKREMASKVVNISDVIQRVASSCLTNPIVGGSTRQTIGDDAMIEEDEEDEDDSLVRIWEEEEVRKCEVIERVKEMEGFMSEVFEAVSAVKRAYVGLQEAHCPWDPDRMRVADASVVAELRRLGRLRDRFRRGGAAAAAVSGATASLREVVAPYEAALEDLKKELRAKEAEVDNLKGKLRAATTPRGGSGAGRRMGRFHSSNKVACISRLV